MTANNSARANGRRRRVSPKASTPDAATVTAAKAALTAVLAADGKPSSDATEASDSAAADPAETADDVFADAPEPAAKDHEAAAVPRAVAKFTPKTTNHTEEKPMSGEVVDVSPKPAKGRTKKAEIQLHQPMGSVLNRPVMPSDLEIVGMMTVAGDRPVVASHLELFGSFLNGRPIESSHEKIFEMLGDRPVFESAIKMVDDGGMPGGRPIMASSPDLLAASLLPGGRPIASNDIDDATTLMGYLD